MTYVYDIILNFNNDLYDFFEWQKEDSIYHIKRINLIKTNSTTYNEILDNRIKFDTEFILSVFHKCEYYDNKKVFSIPYAFLVTDSYRVMALSLNMDGIVIKYSSLLLDDEEDILDISNRLAITNLNYQILSKKEMDNNMTRKENMMLKYIKKDLENSYKEKNINKLKYLYYEYFNELSDDIDDIYHKLIMELKNNFNKKHYDLYELIKLSLSQKNV